MTQYIRCFEVVRSDGMLVRINSQSVSAIMESQTKGGEPRCSIILNNNTTIATRDLGLNEVWALFVESVGYPIAIAREPKKEYMPG